MKLTAETLNYMRAQWGLDYAEESDDVIMLWSSGYYEECCYLLVHHGAVEEVNEASKEMIKLANSMNETELHEAVDTCLSKDGDYKIFECNHCQSTHFINSLYYDDASTWRCDSCAKPGLTVVKPIKKEES